MSDLEKPFLTSKMSLDYKWQEIKKGPCFAMFSNDSMKEIYDTYLRQQLFFFLKLAKW